MLALNHRAVAWMERISARPYPFEKIDFLLAPAFPFGGMEHPGAIFYNENSFIFRERPTTPPARPLLDDLHEVAHQWFGDLVTMQWFDDLWLKEGFATYMAAKAQYALDSTGGCLEDLLSAEQARGLRRRPDVRHQLALAELDNLDQAKSNYGAIVYNKAPERAQAAQLSRGRGRVSEAGFANF